jgi:hypothetical protein
MSNFFADLNQFNPWLPLQSAYGAAQIGKGKKLRFQSALIDGARFVACLTYVFAAEGLYVRRLPLLPFFSRQQGLLIPWEDIEIIKADFWTTYPYEIHMQRLPQVDFRVRRRIGDKLLRCQTDNR